MSVTKYQIYLKTVELGSFTAAARALNFTQSGVSHAIGSLEEELGFPLLVRSHGGVTPTADGRALAPYFQEMCALSHRLEQHAEDLRGLDTGLIRVATFTSVSEKWLPGMLKTFQEKYPRIEFELLPSNFNNEISDWVLHGQADCGFISLPTPAEKYLDYWLLQRDQWKGGVGRGGWISPSRRRPWSSTPSSCWMRATIMRSRPFSITTRSGPGSNIPFSRTRPFWPWSPAAWASASWRS